MENNLLATVPKIASVTHIILYDNESMIDSNVSCSNSKMQKYHAQILMTD